MRIHRLVGMSCPFRFPVYERNLRETGNVSQQSQHDDKLLFIRVMSLTLRCSWHWLCRTHIHTQYTHTESLRWSDIEWVLCKWPANGAKRKCIFKHIFSSVDIYIYIYIYIYLYTGTHTAAGASHFFPKIFGTVPISPQQEVGGGMPWPGRNVPKF